MRLYALLAVSAMASLRVQAQTATPLASFTINTTTVKEAKCFKDTKEAEDANAVMQSRDIERGNDISINVDVTGQNADEFVKKWQCKQVGRDDVFEFSVASNKLLLSIKKEKLEGVESLSLQLNSQDGKKCFALLFILAIKKPKPPAVKPDIPSLVIADPGIKLTPCVGCEALGNVVTYNFSNNVLTNEKIKEDNSGRTVESKLLRRRWTNLPYVNQNLAFNIINVNPFKYDISISDSQRIFTTEVPASLIGLFSLPANPSAVAAGEEDQPDPTTAKKKANLQQAIAELEEMVKSKTIFFQSAADCYNPCEALVRITDEVNAYFTKNLGFSGETTLEAFLLKSISTSFDTAQDKQTIASMQAAIKAYTTFRFMASGKFSYRILQLKDVDQYIFKVNITPKTGIAAGARVINQEVAVDILGGFKVDVSSGLFLTDLTDHRYSIRPDSTVIKTANGYADSIVYNKRGVLTQQRMGKEDFGVYSMMHFYPKLTKNVNLAFSLGAGVSLSDKPKLRYLSGISLLAGKVSKLILSYGVAMGFRDELSDKYKADGGAYYVPYNESKLEFKKVFKTMHFVSLGFSLPLMKKKENTASASSGSSTGTAVSTSTGSGSGSGSTAAKQ